MKKAMNYLLGLPLPNGKTSARCHWQRLSLTIMALIMMMLAPQGAKARELGPWNIWALADACGNNDVYGGANGEGAVPLSSTSYSGITNGFYGLSNTTIGSVTMDLSRFAFRSARDRGWYLYKSDSGAYAGCGLLIGNGTPEFAITKLRPNDVVKVTFKGSGSRTVGLTFVSGSAKNTGGNTLNANDVIATSNSGAETVAEFTASALGDVVISTNGGKYSTIITYISITRPDVASYSYDPAIEVYNLTQQNSGSASMSSTSAGYLLDNGTAYYIINSGYELNNRVAIKSASDLSWNSGLKYGGNSYSMVSISNLNADDRVKITYSDGSIIFANEGSVASGDVFLDASNDGEKDDSDDVTVAGGNSVENWAWYTMLEDGHIDLVLLPGAKITKIEIYSDHKAAYVDTNNGDGSHTLTFDGTGQLIEKTAYIPGLKMEFGDADAASEHFFVTESDKGPVSWGEDPNGFKMAKNNEQRTDLGVVPSTGTFYKFIPEVTGTLHISFKALSVAYGWDIFSQNSSNETVTGDQCPYIVMDDDGNGTISILANTYFSNGAYKNDYNNGFNLVKGHTYYFFGWWPGYETNNGNDVQRQGSCGVAKLVSATYMPAFMMPELACVTTNGATSFDGSTSTPKIKITGSPTNLAFSVKKTSENISVNASDISLDENGYLKISKISYNDNNKDKAGVILVSATAGEGEHVFALTIPYSAAFNNGEGHKWDFKEEPLSIGRYFDDFYANEKVINKQKLTESDIEGMTKNTSSQLYNEIHKAGGTDWTFTYRQVGTNGSAKDPMFQNVYDMCGDNADMIWETEGLWFDTPSNKSAIMNETTGTIVHSNAAQHDPDRYVAILPDADGNSSFTIPALTAGDHVRIYMGSGDGSGSDACFFKISNAQDALGRNISENDIYKAAGSAWTVNSNSTDASYHVCYNFIAKGGDMTFKMVGGSITKIYSIEIYQGERRVDNSVLGARNYYGMKGGGNSGNLTINLHNRGKGENLANGVNVSNEVIATSGNIVVDSNFHMSTNVNDVVWNVDEGTFGVARVRLKCMEYNQNYVTDYADWNLTVGYKEKVDSYSYTWDFTDIPLTGDDGSGDDIDAEYENNGNNTDKALNISLWDEDGAMIVCNPDYADNSYSVFWNNKEGKGNQLYANGKIIPETKGLWFYMDNNDAAYNGSMRIDTDGLHLANTKKMKTDGSNLTMGWWNYKMIVPAVPANRVVYLRMARDNSVGENDYSQKPNEDPVYFFAKKFQFDWMNTKADIGTERTDICKYIEASDGDYIVAIKNTGAESDLTFTLNGWTLKKLAIADDLKTTMNTIGWASESRNHAVDHSLTKFFSGQDLKVYAVSSPNYTNRTLTLTDIASSNAPILPAEQGCIIYAGSDSKLEVMDGGFHFFLPDMHDAEDTNKQFSGTNMLKAQLTETSLGSSDGNYTNYVLTNKYYNLDESGNPTGAQQTGPEMFYRVSSAGIKLRANSAYLQLPTELVKPNSTNPNGAPMFKFIFDGEGENNVATSIDDIFGNNGNGEWYNLSGQKLNGMPQKSGLYIVNGKKVSVK